MTRRVTRMAETLTPDICVIGGGAGAASVAIAAAAFGVPVVLVDRRRWTATARGGVVSQALLAAAKRAAAMRDGGAFRRDGGRRSTSISPRCAITCGTSPRPSRRTSATARLTGLGVRVIEGDARFKDRRTVVAGERFEIRARRFVIATGSAPALPPIPGLDQGRLL